MRALILPLIFLSPLAAAPYPTLVKDINDISAAVSSSAGNLTAMGSMVFFTATDDYGVELWKSDGSAAGTVMVKDIASGNGSSSPELLTNVNGTLFFRAQDGTNGTELWMSDGSAAGTVMVKDIASASASSSPEFLTIVNGTLFFRALNGTNGTELWKSDGTADGTVMVKDIFSGSGSSSPSSLTNVNGTLFFRASDGVNGYELWKSDGTAAGTVMVKDIVAGSGSGDPAWLTNVNGTLFFRAYAPTNGYELWKSDGTAAGTVMIKDILAGSGSGTPANFTDVNGTLFFQASEGVNGYELWKSDGTVAGTVMVKDIAPGSGSSSPDLLSNLNGTLFFRAQDGTNGTELWKSDGTAVGTVMVKDIVSGSGSADPNYLTNVNGTLFFRANYELWKSDGTAAGTVLVKDIVSGGSSAQSLTNVNGTLFFQAYDPTSGTELWKSDGTAAGTVMVRDITSGTRSSSPTYLTDLNGTLFFRASNGDNGSELWKSDGTVTGTVMVNDIFSGSGSGSPAYLTNVNGTLFFLASNGVNGTELWKSDGTAAGTVMVKDIAPGSASGLPTNLTNVNGTLFFQASDGVNGYELWKSDGTAAGTVMVMDILAGSGSGYPGNFTDVNGTLFFVASNSVNGSELWKSDGTTAGTVMVKDIASGSGSSSPAYLTNVNGTLFFQAFDAVNGTELWKSDGTAAGTVMVNDMRSGSGSSYPTNCTAVNGTLFFQAYDGVNGYELWQSDGTTAGTVMVKDIASGSGSSFPSSLTNVNGTLFFRASDGVNGIELWKSDGTAAGTVMVKDIVFGSGNSSPELLSNVNGTLFFRASDGGSTLLYRSDGTSAGTMPLNDLNTPFTAQGAVTATGNNTAFLAASLTSTGTELFSFDLVISTSDPTNPGLSSVTLNGSVNPGGRSTTAVLEYGTTTGYGTSIPLTLSPSDGTGWQNFSIPLTGLTPGTTYYYRLTATNSLGTFQTAGQNFTTYLNAPPVITSTPFPWAVVGGTYEFIPQASNTGTPPVHYTVLQKPAWLEFDGTRLFGTPPVEDEGLNPRVILRATNGDNQNTDLDYRIIIGRLVGPVSTPPGGGNGSWVLGMPELARDDGDEILVTGVSRAEDFPILWGLHPEGVGMKMNYPGPSGADGSDFTVPEGFSFDAGEILTTTHEAPANVADGIGLWKGVTRRPASIGGAPVYTYLHAYACDISDPNAPKPFIGGSGLGVAPSVGAALIPDSGDLRVHLRLDANAAHPVGSAALDWFNALSGKLPTDRTIISFSSAFYWVNTPPRLSANTGTAVPQGGVKVLTTAMLNATDTEDLPEDVRFVIGTDVLTGTPNNGTLELFDGSSWNALSTLGSFTPAQLAGGSVRYVNSGNYQTHDGFQFRILDAQDTVARDGNFTLFTFAITVTLVNHPPIAADHAIEVGIGSTFTGTLDFSDPDIGNMPQGISITSAATPAKGTFTITNAQTGAFTYVAAGIVGTDVIEWQVTDGEFTSLATLAVTVTNQAPVANNQSFAVGLNATYNGTLDFRDADLVNFPQPITVTSSATPTLGTFTITNPATGAFAFVSNGTAGSEEIEWQVSDGALTASATLTLNIANQPPVVQPLQLAGVSHQPLTTMVIVEDPDLPVQHQTLAVVDAPVKGTVTFDGFEMTYTINAGRFGADEFTIRSTDSLGAESDPVTVSVMMRPSSFGPSALFVGGNRQEDNNREGVILRFSPLTGDVYTLATNLGAEARGVVWSESRGKLVVAVNIRNADSGEGGPEDEESPVNGVLMVDPLTGEWGADDIITIDGNLALPLNMANDGPDHVLLANGPGGVLRISLEDGTQEVMDLGLPPDSFVVSAIPNGPDDIWVSTIGLLNDPPIEGILFLCNRTTKSAATPVSFTPSGDPVGLFLDDGELAVARSGVPVETITLGSPLSYTPHGGAPEAPWFLPVGLTSYGNAWLVADPFAESMFLQNHGETATSVVAVNGIDGCLSLLTVNGSSGFTVTVEGLGIVGAGAVVDFGRVTLGDDSSRNVTITNNTTNLVTLGSPAVDGPGAGNFSVSPDPAGVIAPGETVSFAIEFTPGAAGPLVALLGLPSDVAGQNTFTLDLTGIGNHAPTFAGYAVATAHATRVEISLVELLSQAADADSDAMSVSAVGPSMSGNPVFLDQAGGFISYSPGMGFSGSDSFPVTISDIYGATVSGSVTVTVAPKPSDPGLNKLTVTMVSGKAQLRFRAVPNTSCQIQRSIDMNTWQIITTVPTDDIGELIWTDTSDPPPPRAFYRVRLP